MATAVEHNDVGRGPSYEKDRNGTSALDHAHNGATPKQRVPYDYGGNPLAHVATNNPDMRLTAFGGEFQPGLYKPPSRGFANPAPLGLSAFALTTFVLSLINVKTRSIGEPHVVIALAYGYGGLVQLLAGMWEMAVGNTFGATALSSYGGFWLSFAILLTPGFAIETTLINQSVKLYGEGNKMLWLNSFGLYLMGWFVFTTLLLLCTLRSTVAFCSLFVTLDLAFLMLGIGYLNNNGGIAPQSDCIVAGGAFGLMAAFIAWYNALAGIADSSNSFFVIPVAHFPWSDKGRERRDKVDNSGARDSAHLA